MQLTQGKVYSNCALIVSSSFRNHGLLVFLSIMSSLHHEINREMFDLLYIKDMN